jgi:hypothetical protein
MIPAPAVGGLLYRGTHLLTRAAVYAIRRFFPRWTWGKLETLKPRPAS